MLRIKQTGLPVVIVVLTAGIVGYMLRDIAVQSAAEANTTQAGADDAQSTALSPVNPVADRDVYYPGSEAIGPDEMRVVACGTGMPNARPKQAAACWLVELGNGDKFIFDIGTASADRLSAMKIPYDYLDKVFIGHLHADHFGDLDALWVGECSPIVSVHCESGGLREGKRSSARSMPSST